MSESNTPGEMLLRLRPEEIQWVIDGCQKELRKMRKSVDRDLRAIEAQIVRIKSFESVLAASKIKL